MVNNLEFSDKYRMLQSFLTPSVQDSQSFSSYLYRRVQVVCKRLVWAVYDLAVNHKLKYRDDSYVRTTSAKLVSPIEKSWFGDLLLRQEILRSPRGRAATEEDAYEGQPHYRPKHEIVANLFLGDVSAAEDIEASKRDGIRAVLSICKTRAALETHFDYKLVEFGDRQDGTVDLLPKIEETFSFIHAHIEQKEGVLVHCAQGASRSAAIVAGYLMKRYFVPAEDALRYVQARRPLADPNPSFRQKLHELQQQIQTPDWLRT